MSTNFTYNNELADSISLFETVITSFEADEQDSENVSPNDEQLDDVSQVEIAPPPESVEQQNSDFFINGKVRESLMDNDLAIINLVNIIASNMKDADKIKNYVDVFFTELGLNDIDPEKFKLVSGEIWNKLESIGSSDYRTSLIEFETWVRNKIQELA